ncbi:hypothetical protein PINS_up016071 [Pythium insidiosum]|nr:hypothetical protein PINS_up016071 [Pythium insidiosum]
MAKTSSAASKDDVRPLSDITVTQALAVVFIRRGARAGVGRGIGGGTIIVPSSCWPWASTFKFGRRRRPTSSFIGRRRRQRHLQPAQAPPRTLTARSWTRTICLAMIPSMMGGAVRRRVLLQAAAVIRDRPILLVLLLAMAGVRTTQKALAASQSGGRQTRATAAAGLRTARAQSRGVARAFHALQSPAPRPRPTSRPQESKTRDEQVEEIHGYERRFNWRKHGAAGDLLLGHRRRDRRRRGGWPCGGVPTGCWLWAEIRGSRASPALRRVHEQAAGAQALPHYPTIPGDIQWTRRTVLFFPVGCTIAGVVAGMFGVGGAIIAGPLMLEMACCPRSRAPRARCSCSTRPAAATSQIVWDWSVLLCVIAFGVTMVAQVCILGFVRRTGRQSIIVFCVAITVCVGACLMAYSAVRSTVRDAGKSFSIQQEDAHSIAPSRSRHSNIISSLSTSRDDRCGDSRPRWRATRPSCASRPWRGSRHRRLGHAPETKANSSLTSPSPAAVVECVGLVLWIFTTLNAVLDPAKTIYGYYVYSDSDNQEVVWTLTVVNEFDNRSAVARPCEYPEDRGGFLGCYFELPVFGTGSLAGARCRSFYPTDKGALQHIGNFFGNCTLADGSTLHLPSERFATTQWSVQTSSTDKPCLERLGEGAIFPCDAHTTMNGRVLNHRVSRSEAAKWCREFGGFYVNDLELGRQQVLLANASLGAADLAFTSVALDVDRPVFNLYDLLGCSAEVHIGGAATHISTRAFYGLTTAPWTARTTRTARRSVVTRVDGGDAGEDGSRRCHHSEGDLTQIRSWFKDLLRLSLLTLIVFYRVTSIYYPMFLVYARQPEPFVAFTVRRSLGIILHKRERRSLLLLLLLSLETLLSGEDIIMFCQQIIYTSRTSYVRLVLKYMSIARIVWPAALVIAAVSRVLRVVLPQRFTIVLAEDLFLIACPIVWVYIPAYVTKKGMQLFQGYKWGGAVVRHYANSIQNVTRRTGASLLVWVYSGGYRQPRDTGNRGQAQDGRRAVVARARARGQHARHLEVEAPADHARKIKQHGVVLCEGSTSRADGFLCLVYGPYQVLGGAAGARVMPVRKPLGPRRAHQRLRGRDMTRRSRSRRWRPQRRRLRGSDCPTCDE